VQVFGCWGLFPRRFADWLSFLLLLCKGNSIPAPENGLSNVGWLVALQGGFRPSGAWNGYWMLDSLSGMCQVSKEHALESLWALSIGSSPSRRQSEQSAVKTNKMSDWLAPERVLAQLFRAFGLFVATLVAVFRLDQSPRLKCVVCPRLRSWARHFYYLVCKQLSGERRQRTAHSPCPPTLPLTLWSAKFASQRGPQRLWPNLMWKSLLRVLTCCH